MEYPGNPHFIPLVNPRLSSALPIRLSHHPVGIRAVWEFIRDEGSWEQQYIFDLSAMTQTNSMTGKVQQIRRFLFAQDQRSSLEEYLPG